MGIHGHGYSTSIRNKFVGIRRAFHVKIGRVFVFWFWGRYSYSCIYSIFSKYSNTFSNNTFEYVGILWNALEYFALCNTLRNTYTTKKWNTKGYYYEYFSNTL